jgi:putative transposase
MTTPRDPIYAGHRYPAEIISYAVWLYFRFPLSLRMVESLWRAVDQDGFVLDILVQSRRDKKAAKRLFRKLLRKQGRAPRVLVTDKLKSYAAAKREIMPGGPCCMDGGCKRSDANFAWV